MVFDVAQLPPSLQDHLNQVAIPTYQEMMATGTL
jgi:hypothetical protein